MGNCLRFGSHAGSPTIKKADRPGSPTITYASSTVYYTAKSRFSETVSEGNWDANTAKSHWFETVAEGNEGLSPSGRNVWAESGLKGASSNLKAFTFAELKTATGNFDKHNLIGEGGFGKVYKGWIDERTFAPSKPGSGMVVAVKKLSPQSVQGLDELQSEVSILGKLSHPNMIVSHPNLIKLLGFCFENVKDTDELLLVYEFMPNGSLADHLFKKNPPIEPFPWNLRLKIAIGAARGLAFVHSSRVIYRNFKSSDILLDENYNAKLSDFGLAREGPAEGHSHVTTRVMGTYGYAAPEYIATGHLYVKSDVYGFGVVLLEMMTGLRAFDISRPNEQKNLVAWLKPILTNKERLKDVMDERMKGQYSSNAMLSAAKIASRCLEQDPRSRPSMDEVVNVLEQIESMKERPK